MSPADRSPEPAPAETHGIELRVVSGQDAIHLGPDVWPCYDAVFGDADAEETWRADLFERHAAREDYRLAVADLDGRVVGFGWAHVGRRGQYWSDLVSEALPREVSAEWVGGHLELVELAVLPSYRHRGLGRRLHDLVLDGFRGRCLLGTVDDSDDPAVRLYLRAGWRRLGLLRPGVQVMGIRR